jgi:spore coat protein CotH
MRNRTSPPLVATVLLVALWLVAGHPLVAQSQVDSLLDGSSLEDLWVHLNARDWEDLHTHYQDNTYYPADVEWRGTRVRNAAIRVRGNASRNDHKPSFRLDFNRYVTGQTFFGLDALSLDSSWLDPSMITNRLSMLLFRQMGIAAPRVAHVRLFAGASREYVGVYAATEEVTPSFLRSRFGEDTGYLYEFNHLENDNWGFQDPGPRLGWYVPRFSPKTHEFESVANLYMPIRDLVQRINDAPQSDLESHLNGYLDVNAFITQLAIQNFVAQTDGLVGAVGTNNFYLYRFAGKTLSVVIPWDQGNAFGSFGNGLFGPPPWWNVETNVLALKIWNEPKYRARYLAALLQIADLVSADGWLLAEAQRDYQQIRDAVYADAFAPYPPSQFEQAHVSIQQYIRMRPDEVRQFVASLTQ